jgi:hypothetical protein
LNSQKYFYDFTTFYDPMGFEPGSSIPEGNMRTSVPLSLGFNVHRPVQLNIR